jgi:hypothetical protein
MKPRSKHYFTRLHSYADALATVEALKARGFRVKAYGRMRDKRKTFEANGFKYGRFYGNAVNYDNDISLNSPLAQYAYAWAIYVYPRKQRVKKGKLQLDTLQIEIDKAQELVDSLAFVKALPSNPGEHPCQVVPVMEFSSAFVDAAERSFTPEQIDEALA